MGSENLAFELFEKAGVLAEEEWRRKQIRRQICEAIALRVGSPDGEECFGYTTDVTREALGVIAQQYFDSGTVLYVRRSESARDWNRCRVVHCQSTIAGFRVGLVLGEDASQN